jgi:hypothetical protein
MTVIAAVREMPAVPRWGIGIQALALVALTLAVLVVRRPDQFLHPYIWVEDGDPILKAYAERGWASFWDPISGYLVLATKLITLSAFTLSIEWAPEIALVLTVAFTCAVVAAVAFSPTHLRWPFLCAIAVLTIPVDPEVYAVSLLAFWWAGLLLLLALLWDREGGAQWLRAGYIVLGGLSSPVALPIAGLFVVRAVFERQRSEFVAAAIALTVAAIQAQAIFGYHHIDYRRLVDPHVIRVATDKFAGYLFVGHRYGGYYSGAIVLPLVALALWRIRQRLTPHFALLVLAWMVICAATTLRNPIGVIDPLNAGPRYFFYPFILFTWILIWISALSPAYVRALALAGCVMGVAWVYKRMTRSHDAVDWRGHIAACARVAQYDLPIHYEGRANNMWHVKLSGQQCRDLIARSLIRR